MTNGIKYLLSCLLLTACTVAETGLPEKEPVEEETSALSVRTLSLDAGTKAVYEKTGADNAANILKTIGVLVTKGSDSREYYSSLVEKQIFTCSSNNDGGGTLTWTADKILNLGDADGTVYAWAPSDAEGKLDDSSPKIPVLSAPAILSEQSFAYGNEWETNQTDYLYGTDTEKKTPVVNHLNSSVALSMQHALAKISFCVMKASGQTVTSEDYVKKVELTSSNTAFVVSPEPATNVVMRLTDGVLTGTSTATSLTLTAVTDKQGQVAEWSEPTEPAEAASGSTDVTFAQTYGLVAPCTGTSMGVKITLGPTGALDAEKDHTYQTKNNTSVNVNWEQGKHYVYTMTVTDRGIEFGEVQVIGWDETPPAVSVPVE